MGDPQDQIKKWLAERLVEKGHGSQAELATRLNVPVDAVCRMKNRNGAKESRRIEAHHVPVMVTFFGSVPPGFDFMLNHQTYYGA